MRSHRRLLVPVAAAAMFALVAAGLGVRLAAHEIPNDVTVQAFLKPEGNHLRLLVRVPLKAMRDLDVPTRPTGYLDLARADRSIRDAATLWIADSIEIDEEGTRLPYPELTAVRVSLPSDRSFADYDRALAHVTGQRLADDAEVYWDQAYLDVLLTYPVQSGRSRFSIRPDLERLGLRVVTVLRFVPPGGAVRAFELTGSPGWIDLDPSWSGAAWRFVVLGFFHILDGTDHLLFLLCLVVPVRRFLPLVAVVTAFTAAHSITLVASAFDMAPGALWFPPLIETLIALSIVFMSIENIVAPAMRYRWIIAFGFGLVHGFGFSFALRETLQFAGSHLLTSLVAFNVGVEAGQLLVLLALVPALDLLFRYVVSERAGTIVISVLIAHTGWHWMTERWEALGQYRIGWPVLDAALLLFLVRWLTLAVVVAAVAWLFFGVIRPQLRKWSAALDRFERN